LQAEPARTKADTGIVDAQKNACQAAPGGCRRDRRYGPFWCSGVDSTISHVWP
jgi:hypothetical protein